MAETGGAASSSAAAGTHNDLQSPSTLDGGVFLLHLLQTPPQTPFPPQPRPDPHQQQQHHFDPAVKAIGPGHHVLPHELFNPHHQSPSPPSHLPSHLPPAHLGDPQHLLQSLPLHLPQPFPPGLWPQAPPGFPPVGLDGSAFNHHIFHLEHQRLGLAAAAAGAGGTIRSASAERTDLAGILPRQGYGEKGIGDQVAVAPGWKHPVARNQGERSFFRAPPGFKQPPAERGTEYDRGSTRLGGQESRSNRLNSQAEKSTSSLGQSNPSHGDRRREAASSPWQRKVVEPGKQYTQARGQSSSGHWAATEDGRPSQYNNQNHFEKSNALGVLHIGDVAKKGILFGEMEINEPLADGQLSVAENFDQESEHDSEGGAVSVKRIETLNGDECAILAEQSTARELDELCEETVNSLKLTAKKEVKSVVIPKNRSRDKDFRCDLSRGHHVSSMRVRIQRRTIQCRHDIDVFSLKFLSIFESLNPAEEEKAKQKQLLLSLEKLINKEWPNARLYLYGSCANSFGVSKSDIDVCLSIDDKDIGKIDILLNLAKILESGNLQNVQALTHARVPIVKLMDPVTGLSCDICINNLLAVVNTRLLKDYALIDHRLRQLAIIVKHWARSRRVNATYQGTLSSYAYVLMCIHFLQVRRPAVLPCLQAMEATFAVTVDNTVCTYFDQVERLQAFGSRNKESIARLLWGFFNYWAYRHDYMNDVISVRTGSIISKQAKDWTRRIGNDRHLICIEDPFEISHDLGRVVDKHSIKILREEFERAANILQYDPNPSVTLFEPYIRPSPEELVQ